MPRNLSGPKGATKNIVAVVLAAGASRRMGQANKLTIPVDGTPMVARVVDALRESGVKKVFVVTGHAPEEIRGALGEELDGIEPAEPRIAELAEMGTVLHRIEDDETAVRNVEHVLQNSRGARVNEDVPAKFKTGDRVLTRNINPVGHTRLPRYARGRHGTIARDYGVFIFPDTHALGEGMQPQHLYSVHFSAVELWGDQASSRDGVYLDLWDDYLDPA